MYSYWQRYSLSCGFTGRSGFKTFLFVKFVDLLEKKCVSYSELSVPFRYDGRFSSNVKSSPQWSAWLSRISQRLEWTIGILNFFFCFHQARKSKQRGKNCGHTHSTGWRSAARYFEDLFPSRRSLSFTTSSTVHMYDFHIFTVIYSLLHRFIWNKYNEHFPVSLVAQLIERWSGLNFFLFKALFSLLLK